jgi:hypothetical protein
MGKLYINLNGLSPILMNNPAGMLNLNAGEQTLGKKKIPTPQDAVNASRYVLPDGNLYVPAVAVRNCLLNATKGQLINKKSALPYISGGLLLIDEVFPLTRNGKPLKGDKCSMDVRRAVVQRQGITRVRARVELPWELECVFEYNPDIVDIKVVETIAKKAGQIVGLLDYRVEKKGWFGRFEVAKIWSE